MLETAQSNLVTLIAGAVITSALLGLASHEGSIARDLAVDAALDGLAARIAGAACSAGHPFSRIAIPSALVGSGSDVASLTLLPDHVRAEVQGGAARVSVTFPPIGGAFPLDLTGHGFVDVTFDPLRERCVATAA
jgi:hypothetical protein